MAEDDRFQEFLIFCTECLGNSKKGLVKLIKKRYREADEDYIESDDFVTLLDTVRQKIETDNKRLFVYLKEFLDELKDNKGKERNKEHQGDDESRDAKRAKFYYSDECSGTESGESNRRRRIREFEDSEAGTCSNVSESDTDTERRQAILENGTIGDAANHDKAAEDTSNIKSQTDHDKYDRAAEGPSNIDTDSTACLIESHDEIEDDEEESLKGSKTVCYKSDNDLNDDSNSSDLPAFNCGSVVEIEDSQKLEDPADSIIEIEESQTDDFVDETNMNIEDSTSAKVETEHDVRVDEEAELAEFDTDKDIRDINEAGKISFTDSTAAEGSSAAVDSADDILIASGPLYIDKDEDFMEDNEDEGENDVKSIVNMLETEIESEQRPMDAVSVMADTDSREKDVELRSEPMNDNEDAEFESKSKSVADVVVVDLDSDSDVCLDVTVKYEKKVLNDSEIRIQNKDKLKSKDASQLFGRQDPFSVRVVAEKLKMPKKKVKMEDPDSDFEISDNICTKHSDDQNPAFEISDNICTKHSDDQNPATSKRKRDDSSSSSDNSSDSEVNRRIRAKCRRKGVISVGRKNKPSPQGHSPSRSGHSSGGDRSPKKKLSQSPKKSPRNKSPIKSSPSKKADIPVVIITDSESSSECDLSKGNFYRKLDEKYGSSKSEKVLKEHNFTELKKQNDYEGKLNRQSLKYGSSRKTEKSLKRKFKFNSDDESSDFTSNVKHSTKTGKRIEKKFKHDSDAGDSDTDDSHKQASDAAEDSAAAIGVEVSVSDDESSDIPFTVKPAAEAAKRRVETVTVTSPEFNSKINAFSVKSHDENLRGASPKAGSSRETVEVAGPSHCYGDGASPKKKGAGNSPKKGSSKQIRRLEALLQDLRDRIEEVRNREMCLDDLDDEASDYLLEDRLQRKIMRVWDKLCELHKAAKITGRETQKYFRYQGTRYPVINTKIEKLINKKKIFPDYHDIHAIISNVNRDKGLNLRGRDVDDLAREAFTDVGNRLQERRQKDLAGSFKGGGVNLYSTYDDPALYDPDLKKQLEINRKTGKTKMDQIVEKYTHRQMTEGDHTEDEGEEEEEEEEAEREEEEKENSDTMAISSRVDNSDSENGGSDSPCLEIENIESGANTKLDLHRARDVEILHKFQPASSEEDEPTGELSLKPTGELSLKPTGELSLKPTGEQSQEPNGEPSEEPSEGALFAARLGLQWMEKKTEVATVEVKQTDVVNVGTKAEAELDNSKAEIIEIDEVEENSVESKQKLENADCSQIIIENVRTQIVNQHELDNSRADVIEVDEVMIGGNETVCDKREAQNSNPMDNSATEVIELDEVTEDIDRSQGTNKYTSPAIKVVHVESISDKNKTQAIDKHTAQPSTSWVTERLFDKLIPQNKIKHRTGPPTLKLDHFVNVIKLQVPDKQTIMNIPAQAAQGQHPSKNSKPYVLIEDEDDIILVGEETSQDLVKGPNHQCKGDGNRSVTKSEAQKGNIYEQVIEKDSKDSVELKVKANTTEPQVIDLCSETSKETTKHDVEVKGKEHSQDSEDLKTKTTGTSGQSENIVNSSSGRSSNTSTFSYTSGLIVDSTKAAPSTSTSVSPSKAITSTSSNISKSSKQNSSNTTVGSVQSLETASIAAKSSNTVKDVKTSEGNVLDAKAVAQASFKVFEAAADTSAAASNTFKDKAVTTDTYKIEADKSCTSRADSNTFKDDAVRTHTSKVEADKSGTSKSASTASKDILSVEEDSQTSDLTSVSEESDILIPLVHRRDSEVEKLFDDSDSGGEAFESGFLERIEFEDGPLDKTITPAEKGTKVFASTSLAIKDDKMREKGSEELPEELDVRGKPDALEKSDQGANKCGAISKNNTGQEIADSRYETETQHDRTLMQDGSDDDDILGQDTDEADDDNDAYGDYDELRKVTPAEVEPDTYGSSVSDIFRDDSPVDEECVDKPEEKEEDKHSVSISDPIKYTSKAGSSKDAAQSKTRDTNTVTPLVHKTDTVETTGVIYKSGNDNQDGMSVDEENKSNEDDFGDDELHKVAFAEVETGTFGSSVSNMLHDDSPIDDRSVAKSLKKEEDKSVICNNGPDKCTKTSHKIVEMSQLAKPVLSEIVDVSTSFKLETAETVAKSDKTVTSSAASVLKPGVATTVKSTSVTKPERTDSVNALTKTKADMSKSVFSTTVTKSKTSETIISLPVIKTDFAVSMKSVTKPETQTIKNIPAAKTDTAEAVATNRVTKPCVKEKDNVNKSPETKPDIAESGTCSVISGLVEGNVDSDDDEMLSEKGKSGLVSNVLDVDVTHQVEPSTGLVTDVADNYNDDDDDNDDVMLVDQDSDDELQVTSSYIISSSQISSVAKKLKNPEVKNNLIKLEKASKVKLYPVVKQKPKTEPLWLEEDENADLIENYVEPDSSVCTYDEMVISSSYKGDVIILSDSD